MRLFIPFLSPAVLRLFSSFHRSPLLRLFIPFQFRDTDGSFISSVSCKENGQTRSKTVHDTDQVARTSVSRRSQRRKAASYSVTQGGGWFSGAGTHGSWRQRGSWMRRKDASAMFRATSAGTSVRDEKGEIGERGKIRSFFRKVPAKKQFFSRGRREGYR